ncbi:DMT family transporter [Sphingoaurantiacus capsulatus]|uniref:DMT family transporter n=1 Tax=Sphingoaurantiacus capsulatus TaxID=1771310 RepID=A0ABV7XFA1_9SPHN
MAPPASPADYRRAIWLRLAAGLTFAIMAAGVKLASDHGAHVVEIIFYRNLFSLPLVFGWLLVGPGWAGTKVVRPKAHVSRAIIGLTGMVLNFQAIRMLPLAEATVISFSVPFFATALAAIFLAEPVGRHRWTAIAVGLVGVVIVVQPGGSHIEPVAALVGIVAALAVATVTVTLRQLGSTESATATVFWFSIASTIVTGLTMPWFFQAHDAVTWGLLLWVGIAGGAAQLVNTASLRLAPVPVLAPFDYLQLLWAVLLGWLIWQTSPTAATWAGAAVIVASGLYIVHRERALRRQVSAAPESPRPEA